MASRFWVGGTSNWDLVTTTHWSATSGGAGGASVPTASDAVFLDGSSGTGVITLAQNTSVASLDCSGYTGTLAFATFVLNTNGAAANVTLSVGMTATNVLIQWSDNAVGTLISAGKTINGVAVGVSNGSVGVLTLGDDLTLVNTPSMQLVSGTLNTNGKTCTWVSFVSSNTNTRTLTLGASVITVTGSSATVWDITTATNLTLNPGTSSITFTGVSPQMNTGGRTYYDVAFTGSGSCGLQQGPMGFHNLSRTSVSVSDALSFGTGIGVVISGILSITGTGVNRTRAIGPSVGTSVGVSAAVVSLSNVDFRDIAASGAAAPWTGTSLGDCAGNSGITFAAAATRYWVGDTGNWNDPNHWSATSGGAGGASAPLPQDTATFDAASFTANTKTVTFNVPVVGAVDASAVSRTGIVFLFGTAIEFYRGILSNFANVSFSGSVMTLLGRGSYSLGGMQFATAGAPALTIQANGGTYTLVSTLGSGQGNRLATVNHLAGTLDLNGFGIYLFNFTCTGTQTRTLSFNGGTVFLQCTVTAPAWSMGATAVTLNAANGFIVFNMVIPGGVVLNFDGNSNTYGTLRHNIAGSTGSVVVTGNNSFLDIEFNDATNARTLTLTAGSTTTVRSTTPLRSFLGTVGKLMGMISSSSGVPATVALPNAYGLSDFVSVKDITATGNSWYAGLNSSNGGGNTNVIFSLPALGSILLGGAAGAIAGAASSGSVVLSSGASATGNAVAAGTVSLVSSVAALARAAAHGAIVLGSRAVGPETPGVIVKALRRVTITRMLRARR